MVDSFFLHYSDNLGDVISEHRLAASYLDRITCDGSFCFQRLHHCSNLFVVWFIKICSFQALLYVKKAIPTCKVASVCNYHISQSRMREVICAQTAIGWTCTFVYHNVGSLSTLSVHPICAKFLVHLIRSKVQFLAFSMSWAGLRHENLAFPFENFCV